MLQEGHDRRLANNLLDQLVALKGAPGDRRLREHELLHRHLRQAENTVSRGM